MASNKAFVNYIIEQLQDAGDIRAKRMFGEYGLFCDGVFFAVICDNQLFIKITPQVEITFSDLHKAPPYEGAKDYILVEEIDDRGFITKLTRMTCEAIQVQSSKKGRK